MKTLSTVLAMALCLESSLAWAGLDEGIAAYQRRDWVAALAELRPLADNGDVVARSRVGHMLLRGNGVAKDQPQAILLLTQAAEKGDALAQNTLGGLYFRGDGLPRDLSRSLLWFSRAAEQNQPNALNNLGQLYFSGNGVARDEAKAVDYFRRAADLGIAPSWESLGIAHWYGRGVATDHAAAVPWLKKAAERGLMIAQSLYATALWGGDGIAQDRTEAVRWFERAGAQGDGASLFNLGQAKFNGLAGSKDTETGYYYFLLAERQAKPADQARYAEAREKAQRQITPDQESRASRRAEKWAPRKVMVVMQEAETPGKDGPTEKKSVRPRNFAGSGFVINGNGVVLTNAHVVRSCRNIRVSLGTGSRTEAASVLARDEGNDLAALQTSLHPDSIARFREDKPLRPGDAVVAVGFPLSSVLSREPNVTAGVISALNGLRGDHRHYQITAPIQRGNSGGPLTDMGGGVVGVVASTLNAMKLAEKTGAIPQNVSFAIKSELARKFLSDNGISFETAPAGPERSAADVGDVVRRQTAYVECEG